MSLAAPTVHVVDDDVDFAHGVQRILGNEGLPVEVYRSAENFLETYQSPPVSARCMLLDLHLNGMSGLSLLERLAGKGIIMPVIFVTGDGDVTAAVAAMKAGAIDFLEKPLYLPLLLKQVRQALDVDARYRYDRLHQEQLGHRLAILSHREREVMGLLVAGANAKQIAARLGIVAKTAMKHRSRVLEKLAVDSVVQLVRLVCPSPVEGPPQNGWHAQLNPVEATH